MNPDCIFYRSLKHDKIKMNWNNRPIKMSSFLSFLTITVIRNTDHLGACNGWTQLKNVHFELVINGGIVGGIEYLDSLEMGTKKQNQYNNYVNPFYLYDILTGEGKRFFYDYYKDDINSLLEAQKDKITSLQNELNQETNVLNDFNIEVDKLEKLLVGN